MVAREKTEPPVWKAKGMKKITKNLYVIQATLRQNKLWKTSRNMVVIRQNSEELTLINAVRLNADGQEILQRLGFVSRVIRLSTTTKTGAMDDLYYKDVHGAQIWAPGYTESYLAPIDYILDEHSILPIAHARVFQFKNSLEPEAAILIQAHQEKKSESSSSTSRGGILITSEALQNQVDNDLLSASSRAAMSVTGMMGSKIVIPPKWLKQAALQKDKLPLLRDDFERLLRLDFYTLIGAKGAVVSAKAKEEAVMAVEMAFPIW